MAASPLVILEVHVQSIEAIANIVCLKGSNTYGEKIFKKKRGLQASKKGNGNALRGEMNSTSLAEQQSSIIVPIFLLKLVDN